jgi:hypothetical protein
MKAKVPIHENKPRRSQIIIGTLQVNRCTEFFMGWMKKVGHPSSLFSFPLEQDNSPNL